MRHIVYFLSMVLCLNGHAKQNLKIMTLIKFNKPNHQRHVSPALNNVFNEFFEGFPFSEVNAWKPSNWSPAVNISENEKEFSIELTAPGFEKSEIDIEINENELIISGERKNETEEKTKRYTRKEFSFQNFKRRFTLPEEIHHDAISAEFEKGILHINLPKKEVETKVSKKINLV